MASAPRSLQRMRERTPLATARSKDLAVAGLITVLGIAVWIETGTWIEARNLAQDPTVLPRSLAVVLWLVAVGMFVRLARGQVAPTDSGDDPGQPAFADGTAVAAEAGADAPPADDAPDDTSFLGALLALVAVAAYTWIAFRLGWAVTTWVFVAGGVLVMTERQPTPRRVAVVAAIAALAVAVVWFGFVELLSVRMPTTLLP